MQHRIQHLLPLGAQQNTQSRPTIPTASQQDRNLCQKSFIQGQSIASVAQLKSYMSQSQKIIAFQTVQPRRNSIMNILIDQDESRQGQAVKASSLTKPRIPPNNQAAFYQTAKFTGSQMRKINHLSKDGTKLRLVKEPVFHSQVLLDEQHEKLGGKTGKNGKYQARSAAFPNNFIGQRQTQKSMLQQSPQQTKIHQKRRGEISISMKTLAKARQSESSDQVSTLRKNPHLLATLSRIGKQQNQRVSLIAGMHQRSLPGLTPPKSRQNNKNGQTSQLRQHWQMSPPANSIRFSKDGKRSSLAKILPQKVHFPTITHDHGPHPVMKIILSTRKEKLKTIQSILNSVLALWAQLTRADYRRVCKISSLVGATTHIKESHWSLIRKFTASSTPSRSALRIKSNPSPEPHHQTLPCSKSSQKKSLMSESRTKSIVASYSPRRQNARMAPKKTQLRLKLKRHRDSEFKLFHISIRWSEGSKHGQQLVAGSGEIRLEIRICQRAQLIKTVKAYQLRHKQFHDRRASQNIDRQAALFLSKIRLLRARKSRYKIDN